MVNNKVCVIVGGADVICAYSAKEMAKNGYVTAIVDTNIDNAKRIADEICTFGGLAKAYEGNCYDYDSLSNVRRLIYAEFGKCNVIVNNLKGDLDGEAAMDCALLSAKVFIREMSDESGCCVVNICPSGELETAAEELSRKMAVNLADSGVRVNAIIYKNIIARSNKSEFYNDDNTPTESAQTMLEAIPMGRFGRPEEVVGALKYLSDPMAASYTTGAVIRVDGGYSAR